MKKYRGLGLVICLVFYAGLYIATKKNMPCEGDCRQVQLVDALLRSKKSYINAVSRCSFPRVSDTLCIYVKDTIGVDWNHLADTACIIAQEKGLFQQKIIVLKTGSVPFDTLAKKICP